MTANRDKIAAATKWSAISQVFLKLVTPLSNMVLARILTPEVFGIIVTVNLVISFTDIFTDTGFQKYLVQHESSSDEEFGNTASVAFWSNLVLSLLFWAMIVLFQETIATAVGSSGYGHVVAVTCVCLPLTSFSTIQTAIFQRQMNFKELFWVRASASLIPFIITVPLALAGMGYWSLVIGRISSNFYQAVVLTIRSKWKIRWFFRFDYMRRMLSFSSWSLLDNLSVWLTSNLDIFFASAYLSVYYLGLYKTSMSTINELMRIIPSAMMPVLFSILSREQKNREQYGKLVYFFQKNLSLLTIPLGIGLFLYRDLATSIALGSQWKEASLMLGMWGLSTAITISYIYVCYEIYRSIGRPKLSFIDHVITIAAMIPAIYFSVQKGFVVLVYTRSIIRMVAIPINYILLKRHTDVSMLKFFRNTAPILFASVCMIAASMMLKQISHKVVWQLVSIIICAGVYTSVLLMFKGERDNLRMLFSNRGRALKNKELEP